MLREQFIAKTIIMAILGVLLVYAAIAQAESHPITNDKKRSPIRVIFAIVCALITVFYACVAINSIVFMAFPTEMLPQPITPNTIYRHTSVQQIWGAATLDQITFFSALTVAILFLAISCYLVKPVKPLFRERRES